MTSKHPIPDDVLKHHTAILGKTGSGKTSTEKLAVEQVVAEGFRVCVLDAIKSDWWGITSSANGDRPGLAFKILGGPRGHVPLHSSAGKVIGQLVGSGKLPLSIIDMADFEAGGLQRFFIDFAPALMRSARGVVYLVIEEAHEFAPKERSGIGAENMAIHWAKKLATAGRSKGIRLIVATQRIQALHNAVLGSCETVIAHRLTTPADQEPVLKWLKANADKEAQEKVASSLSSLPTGTGWICSGEARIFEQVKFPKFKTYDNTATPTGDVAEIAVKTATVDQEELRAIIGDAVKEAEANDPKALRAEIARLKKEISSAPKPAAPAPAAPKAIEEAYAKGRADGYANAVSTVQVEVAGLIARINALGEEFKDERYAVALLKSWADKAAKGPPGAPADKAAKSPPLQWRGAPSPTPDKHLAAHRANRAVLVVDRSDLHRSVDFAPSEHLPSGERACLIAIAQHSNGVRREQLTVLTGYKRSSRDAYIQRLRTRGHIEVERDRIIATEVGIAALGHDYQPLPTGAALREHCLARLPEGERRVLEVLIAAYPDPVEREAIDAETDYKRSSRDAYLQRLMARELISSVGRGAVKASDDLFEERS
jgi:hypothetical protein